MVKVTITVDDSAYASIVEKTPEIKQRGLNLTGQEMLKNLSLNSPVDQGLLRQWHFSKTSVDEIEIKSPAKYAQYVNDGTGVYAGKGRIKPKTGKVLVFKPGKKYKGPVVKKGKFKGLAVFKSVKGQKGQKFVEKSIKQTQKKVQELFIKAINDVI